jgi:hypothetical protein
MIMTNTRRIKMITQKETNEFCRIIGKATNKQLYDLLELVNREIRLSETAIKEGEEKRK